MTIREAPRERTKNKKTETNSNIIEQCCIRMREWSNALFCVCDGLFTVLSQKLSEKNIDAHTHTHAHKQRVLMEILSALAEKEKKVNNYRCTMWKIAPTEKNNWKR